MSFTAEEHSLKRCVFVQFQPRLAHYRDFAHADELCDQMYMDDLGHGLNGRPGR